MKLDAISIITADMPAAIRFYSALGLELCSGGPDAPHSEFSSGSLRVLLDTEDVARSIDPGWVRPTDGHTMSLAFDCGDARTVDTVFADLTTPPDRGINSDGGINDVDDSDDGRPSARTPVAGIETEPWDAFWGQRYAVITDPDGNLVDLFAALPS